MLTTLKQCSARRLGAVNATDTFSTALHPLNRPMGVRSVYLVLVLWACATSAAARSTTTLWPQWGRSLVAYKHATLDQAAQCPHQHCLVLIVGVDTPKRWGLSPAV